MNIRKLTVAALAGGLLALPSVGLAQANPDLNAADIGFNTKSFQGNFRGISTNAGLVDTIIKIINALLVLAAIAAIVFVIIGGVRYITAQGDEDAVAQAKNTIIYAIIGIIVILLAVVIVNFFVRQVG